MPDISNQDVVRELESWKFSHWFTPQNVVSIVAFVVGATVLWMSATNGIAQNANLVAQLDAELAEETENREAQIDRTEKRLNQKLDDLKNDINTKFRDQNADIKQIQNMLLQMIQRNNERDSRP